MKVIGLTGPTGAGKSTFCTAAAELGITVIDCDGVAREVVRFGGDALPALVREFGKGILRSDGSLDRAALASVAFANQNNTARLNRTILPFIVERINLQLEELADDGVTTVILDAPTLYESGADIICDTVIAILAPLSHRLQRIMDRDDLTLDAAMKRINAGQTDDFYEQRANYIIKNDSGMAALKTTAAELLNQLI